MTARASLAELSVPEGTESMNRLQRATRATVGGRQPDEPAAMSLRCGCCQSRERPRKWPGSVAARLYVGSMTTGVVNAPSRSLPLHLAGTHSEAENQIVRTRPSLK
jgi:hypothetical protein